ncbi:glycerol-3-phosphate dehydrogenase [Leptospira tipperaryensis]|uniref:Glycerol-3-phosphate dehydrogenase n=1 Tax=Leptospira tipperaryensis TaxID=2564040 RepID=A0A1D7UX22_9LEPT|nr:glycerol-3-phosphate dehydrogenase/oxidase [Leptospira tipperaryensis]AOP34081.1 glycerol-3-phosphate dehydrogenase [Leptospira tipperaryensis]
MQICRGKETCKAGRIVKMEKQGRAEQISKLQKESYDILFIGGGSTGAGAAFDAAKRGYKTALIEKRDFASGTSSRSTKLIHGGVRYLAQFHFKLIHEALTERQRLLENAPHLVKPLKFVLPAYRFYERPYYGIGLTLYDILASRGKLPSHKTISKSEAIKEFSAIKKDGLFGGITYYDAQFNDARLNVLLARAAEKEGATVANRVELVSFIKENGKLKGANLKDLETGKIFPIYAKVIANTTGVWVDHVRRLDDSRTFNVLSPSQGIHLVFSKEKIPCESAMIIPKTKDGRVVFIIPWEDHVILGTTDTPIENPGDEPLPIGNEVQFLLDTGNDYLESKVTQKDIVSVFVGIRPLISPEGNQDTKNISREEVILVSNSGLVTMGGGKWSTYRKMAEELVDRLVQVGSIETKEECSTKVYPFPGSKGYSETLYQELEKTYKIETKLAKRLQNYYGTEVFEVLGKKPKLIGKGIPFFEEEVVFAAKEEFALGVTDILARRFRILFLDLDLSQKMVAPVATILAKQLKWKEKTKKAEEAEALNLIESLKKSYR